MEDEAVTTEVEAEDEEVDEEEDAAAPPAAAAAVVVAAEEGGEEEGEVREPMLIVNVWRLRWRAASSRFCRLRARLRLRFSCMASGEKGVGSK